ncbi:membrane-bound transcription factor site-2 protease [Neocloeon triangulifer]|uniref:membrane-bound transcription factor site-2 protease n=1 Tax=Neocloeon triangulifer TaxID=2078957 RepID=UPI00286FA67C|nr:membrane-bound transcription factor site-2 protease [Neocloeon triangulifer]XP_059474281.1 membrane-bound transcription factor site-2 protease [Neocloeon triangulifer]XP_059474282.1 membrane-bound transcription factor site-2 protease [Neocloeon triangulifer]XP_059474283.1 membrane-bound transcription factor site-2 protease [Neocloeon triangulifer]
MDGTYLLIGIIVLHCVLFFLDVLFKSCCHLPYVYFVQKTGLEVSFLRLHWHTTAFNRLFQQWSNWRPRLLAFWFSLGVIVSLPLMPVAAFLVLRGLFGSILDGSKDKPSGFELEPVVPGINLPMSQLGNYMTALAIGGILHEFGHALAAGREGISILGCKAHLIVVLPVAAVEISTQRINSLATWRRLRILCAGVWHNVVLSLLALMLLYAISHSHLYKLDQGVVVTSVDPNSGVAGPSGLLYGDHITGLNHCKVQDKVSYRNCLYKAAKQSQTDYCVPVSFTNRNTQTTTDTPCCSGEMLQHLCFHNRNKAGETARWCMQVREVVEASIPKQSDEGCPEGSVSLTPLMEPSALNGTRLVVIKRSNLKKPSVLFLGLPSELYHTVEISNWLPAASYLSPQYPEMFYNFFSYLAALSAGLALLNMLPCYGFDGQHIMFLLSEVVLGWCGVRSSTITSMVAGGFTAVGTSCLLAWLFTAICKIIPM